MKLQKGFTNIKRIPQNYAWIEKNAVKGHSKCSRHACDNKDHKMWWFTSLCSLPFTLLHSPVMTSASCCHAVYYWRRKLTGQSEFYKYSFKILYILYQNDSLPTILNHKLNWLCVLAIKESLFAYHKSMYVARACVQGTPLASKRKVRSWSVYCNHLYHVKHIKEAHSLVF